MGQGATVYRSSQCGAGMDLFRALTFALYHVMGLKGNQPGLGSQAKGRCLLLPVNRLQAVYVPILHRMSLGSQLLPHEALLFEVPFTDLSAWEATPCPGLGLVS